MIFEKDKILKTCYQAIYDCWNASDASFPEFLIPVSEAERQQNEQFLSHHLNHLQKLLKKYNNPFMPKFFWRRKFNSLIDTILFKEPVIGIADTFSAETLSDMQREFYRFFKAAASFDTIMGMEEVGQAARNYLVYDVFTEIHDLPHNMTPAIFGYSMLYPYTDNYIDNPNLSGEIKAAYNLMIAERIIDKPINSNDFHFIKTGELLDNVTHFYEKDEKTDIQNGLLLMLDAQKKSLSQTLCEGQTPLNYDDIFKISSYKGGISVLIDRYYVPKPINEADFFFYLSYGFFLQLADDLQDITEDFNTRRQTLFTYGSFSSSNHDSILKHNENTLNKLFHYLNNIMKEYKMHNPTLKDFITKNCNLLLLYSALLSGENFSDSYLGKITPFLPVSLSFINKTKMTMEPYLKNPTLKNIISDGLCTFDKQSQNISNGPKM